MLEAEGARELEIAACTGRLTPTPWLQPPEAVFERRRIIDCEKAPRSPPNVLRAEPIRAKEVGVHGLPRPQRPVVLRVHVQSRHQPVGEPLERRVVAGETERGSVVVGMRFHGRPHLRGRVGEPALAVVHRACPTPDQLAEGVDLDRPLRQPNAISDMGHTSLETHLRPDLRIDVRSPAELLVIIPWDDADVVLVRAREVVAIDVRSTTQCEGVLLVASIREDRTVPSLDLVPVEVEADDLTLVRSSAGQAGRLGTGVQDPRTPLRILHPVGALTRREVPPRLARAAALREDLHDTIGGFGTVQRRRGRTLDDLDALDVFRADVVQATGTGSASLPGTARGVSVHAHAVDVDERIVGERQAADAAHA